MSEDHLRKTLKSWSKHYNQGRPHMSLGPGIPDSPVASMASVLQNTRHRVGVPLRMSVKSVLGGLHHEYALPDLAA